MDNRRLFALKIFQGLRYDETIQVRCIWGIDYPDGDLEVITGMDYPDGDIKSLSCATLTQAREMASRSKAPSSSSRTQRSPHALTVPSQHEANVKPIGLSLLAGCWTDCRSLASARRSMVLHKRQRTNHGAALEHLAGVCVLIFLAGFIDTRTPPLRRSVSSLSSLEYRFHKGTARPQPETRRSGPAA